MVRAAVSVVRDPAHFLGRDMDVFRLRHVLRLVIDVIRMILADQDARSMAARVCSR